MKLSRSIGYALLAVGYVAQETDKKVILSQDIARKYDMPLEYLLKILQQLVKAKILRSKRGPHGGFFLARPANKITLLQIIEAVNGPMVNYLNLTAQTRRSKFGVRADKVYDTAISRTRAVFSKAKLSDLIAK